LRIRHSTLLRRASPAGKIAVRHSGHNAAAAPGRDRAATRRWRAHIGPRARTFYLLAALALAAAFYGGYRLLLHKQRRQRERLRALVTRAPIRSRACGIDAT
jgi:hypothetical protein